MAKSFLDLINDATRDASDPQPLVFTDAGLALLYTLAAGTGGGLGDLTSVAFPAEGDEIVVSNAPYTTATIRFHPDTDGTVLRLQSAQIDTTASTLILSCGAAGQGIQILPNGDDGGASAWSFTSEGNLITLTGHAVNLGDSSVTDVAGVLTLAPGDIAVDAGIHLGPFVFSDFNGAYSMKGVSDGDGILGATDKRWASIFTYAIDASDFISGGDHGVATASITAADLAGKTITVKNGIITAYA